MYNLRRNHDAAYEGFMYNNQSIDHFNGEIKIEDGVWVRCGTTILSGTDIGEGSIIGAKSLVNKKIPPYVVAVGVPVRVIKPRLETLEQLQNTLTNTNS
jgi:acetyltransferase-like isoleucine patch superfamily enzyme